ncbi:MAG: gliding-motility protein MglA [Asgard group archaeon]|nr:gliding-motility protein MglA [Asgard group archaeon]
MHLKIVFYGPSLSGKTTGLRWLYDQVEGLTKGGFTSIADPTGRTLYFDFTPFSASGRVILDAYTVAGQARHKSQRKVILRGVDGIILMLDSTPEMQPYNVESVEELREFLGDKFNTEVPIVVTLNKRDVPNALDRPEMLQSLGLEGFPVYETIATKGIGVKRAFQSIAREILLKQLYGK